MEVMPRYLPGLRIARRQFFRATGDGSRVSGQESKTLSVKANPRLGDAGERVGPFDLDLVPAAKDKQLPGFFAGSFSVSYQIGFQPLQVLMVDDAILNQWPQPGVAPPAAARVAAAGWGRPAFRAG